MITPERRHLPRTTLERLAYIHIERDNGGIVLNVSSEGLCFQSVAPVERNATIRFSLFEHNRLIDARGELVWTDEAKQLGGLRLTSMSSEAHGQINEWIAQPLIAPDGNNALTPTLTIPLEEDKAAMVVDTILVGNTRCPTATFPRLIDEDMFPHLVDEKASTPLVPPKIKKASTSEVSLFGEFRNLRARRSDQKPVRGDSSTRAAAPATREYMNSGGFSAGLARGLFISALAVSILLFCYVLLLQFGGYSFIDSGQQQRVHSEVQRQTALRAPQVFTPAVGRFAKGTWSPTRPQPSRRIASRRPANKHGSAAIVLEPRVVAIDPSPAKRVLIAAAPQSFDYPVTPDPALTGKVNLKLLIGAKGSVKDVSVRSGNRALAEASVRAVRHWRYRAPKLDGHAVEAEANITITFVGDDAVSINFRR